MVRKVDNLAVPKMMFLNHVNLCKAAEVSSSSRILPVNNSSSGQISLQCEIVRVEVDDKMTGGIYITNLEDT